MAAKSKKEFLIYFLLITIVFLLIHSVGYYRGITNEKRGELTDTDTYMRLVRVEQLAATGDWYDSMVHRSNFPYGDDLHWTRPLDVILLAGAYAWAPFIGFKQGLLYWGIIISPLLGVLSLLALYWAARKVMDRKSRRLLWLLFIAQPILLQVFSFGRPDHHSLLLLLFILLLGCLFRMAANQEEKRSVIIAALIAALAMWISVEFIFAIIMVYLTMGALWLLRGQRYAAQLLLFSLILFIMSAVALFIERPLSALLTVEYDKISIAHLFIFILAIIATYFLTLIKKSAFFPRLLKAAAALSCSGLAIWLLFPAFYQGPMAGVNRAIVPIWLSKVTEVLPLWQLGPYYITIISGSIFLFGGYFVYLLVKKDFNDRRVLLVTLGSGFALFLPLGVYQIRMDYYLLVIIIMLLAVFLDSLITTISNMRISNVYKPFLRVFVMLVFIAGLPALGLLLSLNTDAEKSDTVNPDLQAISVFLNEYQHNDPQAKTVLAFIDFGPEILYRTNYNIIAGPYHRNDSGILYTYRVMAADNFAEAEALLKERPIDLLLFCPESTEKRFYKQTAQKTTFYERLIAGDKPAYLEKVSLPAELEGDCLVFRIKNKS